MLLQDWTETSPQLLLYCESLGIVDKFTYLDSCITAGGHITEEINNRIVKARVAFSNLRHLWRRKDVSLKVKGRVYNAAVRPVLLYASETWPLRVEDMKRLSVFDHRCLRSLAKVSWEQHVSNAAVRHMVFGKRPYSSIDDLVSLNRLRWLGHVLRMHLDRLLKRVLYAEPSEDWKKPRGGQTMTWSRSMKTLTTKLCRVGCFRLPGWGPRDQPHVWLDTLLDMAGSRSQWRTCIHSLISKC